MRQGSRRAARTGAVLAAALMLSSCIGLKPSGDPAQMFVLTPKSSFSPNLASVSWQLLVEKPEAQAGLDSSRIAVRKSAIELDYLADAIWSDTAPDMVQDLLVDSFDASHRIQGVGPDTLGLNADYNLKSELRAFQAEFPHGYEDRTNAVARVRLAVRIVRMPDREIAASQTFEAEAPIVDPGTPGIVAAFDAALGKVLKDTVEYTLAMRGPPPQPRLGR